MGSSNCRDSASLAEAIFPALDGDGSGPQPVNATAARAACAPARRHLKHVSAMFIRDVVEEHNSRWSDHLSI